MRQFCRCAIAYTLWLAIAPLPALCPALAGAAMPGAPAAIKVHGLTIDNVWARATPPGAKVAAGFLHIVNETQSPDRLIGVSAPAAADKVEIHEMIMSGNVAGMRQLVDGLVIAPGESVTLKPGALHLMFLGLKAPFAEGERIKAKLNFERAGEIDVEFAVKSIGAGAPQEMRIH
jgi:copper(I)-binding protein